MSTQKTLTNQSDNNEIGSQTFFVHGTGCNEANSDFSNRSVIAKNDFGVLIGNIYYLPEQQLDTTD